MIQLSNGYVFDYGCASGAMGFNGNGYFWEQPWRWLGALRPQDFTIIIKTLTYKPRQGNLRWYAPWRAVRLGDNESIVNAVDLTNPGYQWWCVNPYHYIKQKGYKVIVSIAPETIREVKEMVTAMNLLDIIGIQLNPFCPNANHDRSTEHVCQIVETAIKLSKHPVIVKLTWQDDFLTICKCLDGRVAAFELINSVPFNIVYPYDVSPLVKYGYKGAVSGPPIKDYARRALRKVKEEYIRTPIISGGGIDSYEEAMLREEIGAEGIVFGSVFIRKPWLPNSIIKKLRQRRKEMLH